jgi:hypothetical protein
MRIDFLDKRKTGNYTKKYLHLFRFFYKLCKLILNILIMKTHDKQLLWVDSMDHGIYAVELKSFKVKQTSDVTEYICEPGPATESGTEVKQEKIVLQSIRQPAYYFCPYHPDFHSPNPGYHDNGIGHCHSMLVPAYGGII